MQMVYKSKVAYLFLICQFQSVTWILFCLPEIHGHVNQDAQTEHLLCKYCGKTIASSKHITSSPSKLALKHWNQTLLNIPGVLVQLFENPQKAQFNVVTFSDANLRTQEEVYRDATWFPDYSWSIGACPKCGIHLGWKYQPHNFNHVTHSESETFVGLILDRLLEETASDTLLLVPNSYKS